MAPKGKSGPRGMVDLSTLPWVQLDPAILHLSATPGGCGCPETRSPGEDKNYCKPSPPLQQPPCWDDWDSTVITITEANEAAIELAMETSDQIVQYSHDCWGKTRELNATLPKDQRYCPIHVRPRDPKLLIKARALIFKEYFMGLTSPTTWGCKRFSNPEPGEKYSASTMMQFFSLMFHGDFSDSQRSLPIYGFVAVRDDCEPLRNYIFNLQREEAVDLNLESSLLPLTSPIRAISVWRGALVEIHLKAKQNSNACDDIVLIDACVEFRWNRIRREEKLKSRIDGPFGAFEMEYMFITHGIEAVVEFDIPREFVGDHVVILARSSGFKDELTLYDAVVEETARVSAVLVASMGGSLFLGFLSMGARACGCTRLEVTKQGSCQGSVLASCEELGSNVLASLRNKGLLPETLETYTIPFSVTFSTMGYYSNGA